MNVAIQFTLRETEALMSFISHRKELWNVEVAEIGGVSDPDSIPTKLALAYSAALPRLNFQESDTDE